MMSILRATTRQIYMQSQPKKHQITLTNLFQVDNDSTIIAPLIDLKSLRRLLLLNTFSMLI